MTTLGSGGNGGGTTIDGVVTIGGVLIAGVGSDCSLGCSTAVLIRCDNLTRACFVLSPYCRYGRDVGGDFKIARILEADCSK